MHYVYLIHFTRPYKRVQHYLGVTNNVENRMKRHKRGDGATLMRAVSKAGIEFQAFVLHEFHDSSTAFKMEKKYKSWHNHKKLCPICKQIGG